jgi:predicted NBD/HSP70 family sugar kinase
MYILFDIGGTKMRLAASLDRESFGEPKIVETPNTFDQGIATFVEIAKEFARSEKIQGIAGGIPGPLNKEKTMVINAPNLPAWNNKPLVKQLQKMLGAPVALENDAALVGLGEITYGSAKNHNIAVYMTISTGVGGARFVNGKVDSNALGFEPGHQIVNFDADAQICPGCNKQGHLEGYISGTALEHRYGKKPYEIEDEKVWDEAAQILAIGLNNTIVHWSPDIVVLGGSMITKQPGISIEKVRYYLKDVMRIFPNPPKIEQAKLQDIGGLYGALALLKNN